MYKKVLVPLDGSELAECVLPHVEVIANGCQIVDIVFVRALEPFQMPHSVPGRGEFAFSEKDMKRMTEQRKAAAEDYLNNIVNKLKFDGATLHSEVLFGQAAESIAEYSEKNDIDLIIIATHGRSGVSRWVWGSVADKILRSSCVPVLMVKAPGCVAGI
jgi:nucleotide-binding universal stress UspA family protein